MSKIKLTHDNFTKYLHSWNESTKTFVESLKKLCKVSPEFTHEPQMKIFKDGLFYESNYSYGKFIVRLRFMFFCLNEKTLRKHDTLVFDLKSFGIKTASQGQIKKMCGEQPAWFDPKNELNDEARKLVEEYLRLQMLTKLGNKKSCEE